MPRRNIIIFVWLCIGAAAAGYRGYYTDSSLGCTGGATIAITIAAGPLNYIGVDPVIRCQWPTPAR